MTLSPDQLDRLDSPVWFCLKARPKHEHLAAITLRQRLAVPCFAPRIRYRKATQRGAVWFVEAMFPGYLFACFAYRELHRQVKHSPGITNIVRFGDRVAAVSESTLAALKDFTGEEELVVFNPDFAVGSSVQITDGALKGLEAVVTQFLPAKERVKVLLEFLGRRLEMEVDSMKVLPTRPAWQNGSPSTTGQT